MYSLFRTLCGGWAATSHTNASSIRLQSARPMYACQTASFFIVRACSDSFRHTGNVALFRKSVWPPVPTVSSLGPTRPAMHWVLNDNLAPLVHRCCASGRTRSHMLKICRSCAYARWHASVASGNPTLVRCAEPSSGMIYPFRSAVCFRRHRCSRKAKVLFFLPIAMLGSTTSWQVDRDPFFHRILQH